MFLIPPGGLEQRRKRCEPEVQKLSGLTWETVTSCNLCSSRRSITISLADRYGLPAHTVLCMDCGLLYLADCLTVKSYSEFYSRGFYRSICSQFNNVRHSIDQIQADQRNYARTLSAVVARYMPGRGAGRLLDVGGSTGIVTSEFVKKFSMSGTVLDPAEEEVAAARALGLHAVVGSVEDYQTDETYDLILLCRSVEHLMDLSGALARIRKLLKPGGLFYCDIADFMELCQQVGAPETVTKVDHRYWLTKETAVNIFHMLGFEPVSMDIMQGFGYAGYLLRTCEPAMRIDFPAERVLQFIEQIHRIQLDWKESGRASRGIVGELRYRAYRMKRAALRFAGRGRQSQEKNPLRPSVAPSSVVTLQRSPIEEPASPESIPAKRRGAASGSKP